MVVWNLPHQRELSIMCPTLKWSATYCLALMLCVTTLVVQARTAEQSIYIESETLRIDEKKGLSHYQGKVTFKQGSLVINAHSIKVFAKNSQLDKVLILGTPVRLKQQPQDQQPIVASANRIEYQATTKIIHLYGNALVTQGNQQFSGEHIQYNSQTAQVTAQGKTSSVQQTETPGINSQGTNTNGQDRVKAVIIPNRDSTQP